MLLMHTAGMSSVMIKKTPGNIFITCQLLKVVVFKILDKVDILVGGIDEPI